MYFYEKTVKITVGKVFHLFGNAKFKFIWSNCSRDANV